MVLLKNDGGILPLLRGQIHSIAVIGLNADSGMMSGGGSAQVDPPGDATAKWQSAVWFPTSPLAAIQAKLQPGASIEFASGKDMAAAEKIARARRSQSSSSISGPAKEWISRTCPCRISRMP